MRGQRHAGPGCGRRTGARSARVNRAAPPPGRAPARVRKPPGQGHGGSGGAGRRPVRAVNQVVGVRRTAGPGHRRHRALARDDRCGPAAVRRPQAEVPRPVHDCAETADRRRGQVSGRRTTGRPGPAGRAWAGPAERLAGRCACRISAPTQDRPRAGACRPATATRRWRVRTRCGVPTPGCAPGSGSRLPHRGARDVERPNRASTP